ncbi:MAG: 30S ribosome-binding factor RbfA [Pseudomonadota bacterium]
MASRFSSKGPSQRQLRAGELIRHALSEAFLRGEVHAPALRGLDMTVTEVRASPDLRNATVFCTTLGGRDVDEAIRKLNAAAGAVRGVLGRKIDLKFTPALTFKRDESFDEARRIDTLLSSPDVRRDLKPSSGD